MTIHNEKNLFHFIYNKHLIAPGCATEEQLTYQKMISNKNETSIPSAAGQITSHENPHIKIGQKHNL